MDIAKQFQEAIGLGGILSQNREDGMQYLIVNKLLSI